ncbi:MAG: signal peptidase I, partial [Candidatus Eisenbacteria bacterium]|nr:signal peptidase I [Candidatus Eisenbacteria bacterium]
IAVIIFLVIRTLAFQAFRIPTGSMENTLLPGDFLFVNKFFYGARVPFTEFRLPGFTEPHRGDIIVFQFPQNPKEDYIKRCIGVGGDVIEVKNKIVYVNGVPQDEPYTVHKDPDLKPGLRDNMPAVKVPPDHLFMMGDNRDFSYDSRFWGPVDLHLVRGRAWITYFSIDPDRSPIKIGSHVIPWVPRPSRMFHLIK